MQYAIRIPASAINPPYLINCILNMPNASIFCSNKSESESESDFVVLMKANVRITRTRVYSHKSLSMTYVKASVWDLNAIFNFLEIRTSLDMFCTEKWKATFDLKYT